MAFTTRLVLCNHNQEGKSPDLIKRINKKDYEKNSFLLIDHCIVRGKLL